MNRVATALGVIVVVMGAFLAFVATRPSSFTIERTAEIQASPADIFPLINDFHKWSEWSPWDKMDPNMKRVYSGSEMGTGAIYNWEGNKKVGKGSMEIVESSAPTKVGIKLDFLTPFEAHNMTEFLIEGKDKDITLVTWKMNGPSPFMMKMVGVFMNMDKTVGNDFETGLANIKAIAEKK